MIALYITGAEKGSGKTTICADLGKHLLNDGKKIGFFKPIFLNGKNIITEGVDSDVAFMKYLFALKESVDLLCPVFSDGSNLANQIKEAYAKVSQGKDIVIIEGISEQYEASRHITETLDARVIVIEDYARQSLEAGGSYEDLGGSLLGIVLNKVPYKQLEYVRSEVFTQFNKAGIHVLGALPDDRTLFSLTIGDLAEYIQGEILSSAEQSAELVENIMIGAMTVDHGPDYFSRKTNKVVVVRSERPDVQLAALETSTRCLVLTGNTAITSVVLYRAEEKGIPIILARDSTTAVLTAIEDALGNTRFNEENKLPRLAEIMEQHFDFQMVYKELGFTS
ncbi:DRTGG domain-containing protein [Chloroflexota bacterium]